MNKFCNTLILVTLFFVSCRKKNFPETIPATQGDFYFNGTVAGNNVSLRAGVNNYYMYSSHTLNNNSLYSFIANLKPTNCTDCKSSLRIEVNDFKYSSVNEAAKIDSSLMPGSYPILGVPFYAVQFKSNFNQPAVSYLWNFGDNHSSTQANPIHIYSTAGNYSVSLKINSAFGCQQYISNIEKIKYPTSNSKISSVNNSANTISFNATSSTSSHTYQWDFGDGTTSANPNPSHTYSIPGTYPVRLRIINAQNDTVYARYNVATQTNPMPCLTNYSIESVTKVVDPSPFSNIVINWTDENGDVYTSNNLQQPSTSYFKIISVEDYDLNERGEKTKRIKISFKCQVYNGALVKLIDNAEAVLCVSYK